MHKFQAKITQLMKRTMTIGLLGAVLAVAIGFISTNAISATPFLMAENEFSPNESAYMIGHVEYTVRGADGEIKQYVQADNVIVDKGKNCTAQKMFNSSDITHCTPGGDGFNFIAIGNGTTGSADPPATATGLTDGTIVGCAGGIDTCEMDRTVGDVTIIPAVTGTVNPNTVITIITRTPFSFTDTTTVEQSGLFDDLSVGVDNMFALKDQLGIDVTPADTLAVTWKITLQ